jgi:hypothetical protein
MSSPRTRQVRVGTLIAVAVAAAAAIVIAAIVLLPRTDPTTVVPSPSASASPSASPTTSPSASASATPSATSTAASGRFTNAVLGYSLQLPPPWRRTPCLSSGEDPRSPEFLGSDTFTSVPPAEESHGDTAAFIDTVSVRVERNPSRLTAEAWANSPRMGSSQGQRIEPATLGGRPGVRTVSEVLQTETTIVAVDDLMYMVGFTVRPSDPLVGAMRAIVASFTFVPRTSAPAGTARPARSAEAVADGLAAGFANKDVAALVTLMGECLLSGVEGGGFGSFAPEFFARTLRDQFAAGSTVIVRPRPIESAPGFATGASFTVATTWTDPGQAPRRVDLIIAADGAFHYWRGMIRRQQPPP